MRIEESIMNQEKKDNKVKYFMIFIGLCVLATCGLAIYYMFFMNHVDEKDTSKSSPKPTVTETKEEQEIGTPMDVNDVLVSTLLKPFEILDGPLGEHLFYFHKGLSYDRNVIPSDVKVYLAISNIIREGKYANLGYKQTTTVPGSEIKQKVQQMFGEDTTFQHVSIINHSACGYESLEYVETTGNYVLTGTDGCGGIMHPFIISRVVSATKFQNHIEIVEKAGLVQPRTSQDGHQGHDVYNNGAKEKLIISNEAYDYNLSAEALNQGIYERYQNQFDTYVYTFKKDKSGNYYFDSINRK